MNLKELISKITVLLGSENKKNKVMPLLDDNYIVVDILEEEKYQEEEYIDLELGNGKELITEEKMLYFYNKV
jgi:hypothetical protein